MWVINGETRDVRPLSEIEACPLSDRHLEGFDQIYRGGLIQGLPRRRTDPTPDVVVARIRSKASYKWWAWLDERNALAVSILIRAVEEQRHPAVLELDRLPGPVGRIIMHEGFIFLGRRHDVGSSVLW